MYQIIYQKLALKQIKKVQKDRKLLERLSTILNLKDIAEDPYSPNYKFEKLKHNLSGYCSKRLDDKNRIIYKVINEEIVVSVVSVLGHYNQ